MPRIEALVILLRSTSPAKWSFATRTAFAKSSAMRCLEGESSSRCASLCPGCAPAKVIGMSSARTSNQYRVLDFIVSCLPLDQHRKPIGLERRNWSQIAPEKILAERVRQYNQL